MSLPLADVADSGFGSEALLRFLVPLDLARLEVADTGLQVAAAAAWSGCAAAALPHLSLRGLTSSPCRKGLKELLLPLQALIVAPQALPLALPRSPRYAERAARQLLQRQGRFGTLAASGCREAAKEGLPRAGVFAMALRFHTVDMRSESADGGSDAASPGDGGPHTKQADPSAPSAASPATSSSKVGVVISEAVELALGEDGQLLELSHPGAIVAVRFRVALLEGRAAFMSSRVLFNRTSWHWMAHLASAAGDLATLHAHDVPLTRAGAASPPRAAAAAQGGRRASTGGGGAAGGQAAAGAGRGEAADAMEAPGLSALAEGPWAKMMGICSVDLGPGFCAATELTDGLPCVVCLQAVAATQARPQSNSQLHALQLDRLSAARSAAERRA